MVAKKRRKSDPYKTIGVGRGATPDEIRSAFRNKAKSSHPDAGGSAEEFAEIKKASVVLLDPKARAHFDETGEIDEPGPDNADQAALGIIHSMMDQILLGDEEPIENDLVKAMSEHLSGEIGKLKQNTPRLRRAIIRAEKMAGKFRLKKAGNNQIDRMLVWHTDQVRASILRNDLAIQHRQRAIELLADYSFDFMKPKRTAHYWSGSSFVPSTTS